MKRIHMFVDYLDDNYGIKTNQVEKCMRLTFEAALLILCAIPSVQTKLDIAVQFVVGLVRLHQVEGGRAKGSILGRAIESGKIPPRPKLSPEKEELLEQIEWHDLVITWIWPVVVPIAVAMTTNSPNAISAVLLLSIGATLGRGLYEKAGMPWWRASRVEWKAERATMPPVDEQAQFRGRWFGDIDKMNFGKRGQTNDVSSDTTRVSRY